MMHFLLICSILLFGCKSYTCNMNLSHDEINKLPNEVNIPVQIILKDDSYSCATTSVAMAISYLNQNNQLLDKDAVWNISGSSIDIATKRGFELEGLITIAVHYNYQYDFYENLLFNEMEYLLSNGALIVIFIRVDRRKIHAVLVKGFNRDSKIFYINDSSEYITELSYDFLNKNWNTDFADLHRIVNRAGFVLYPKKWSK